MEEIKIVTFTFESKCTMKRALLLIIIISSSGLFAQNNFDKQLPKKKNIQRMLSTLFMVSPCMKN